MLEAEDRGGPSLLATHMLQFMVRGLCTKLNYPVTHFATSSLTGEKLYPMVWVVFGSLKGIGHTADGAAANRKFFCIHKDSSGNNVANGVVYKTTISMSLKGSVLHE